MMYPALNKIEPNGPFSVNSSDSNSNDVYYGDGGILGIVAKEFGHFFLAHIRLIFEQAIRLAYKERKHGNLVILSFLVFLEDSKSISNAIIEDLKECAPEKVELFDTYIKVLKVQSKDLRNANFTPENSAEFIDRFVTLMGMMWTVQSKELMKKFSNENDETSRRITPCDIGESQPNAMDEKRKRQKEKKKSNINVGSVKTIPTIKKSNTTSTSNTMSKFNWDEV